MKCPKCGVNISELDEVCSNCKTNLDDYERKIKNRETEEKRKSNFLYYARMISIIIAFIVVVIELCLEMYMSSVYIVITELILCIVLKTFETIIDLLQSINYRLRK